MNTLVASYKSDKRDFIVFLLFFVGLNPITFWGSSDFILLMMSTLGVGYLLFVKQERLDPIIFYILLYWSGVNYVSYVLLGSSGFSLTTFIGSALKIFIGYLFLKIAKENFIVWFEKVVFYLALISLFFFAVQLLQPSIFSRIPFNFAEANRLADGHWNGIIFNYSTYHPFRNAGFAGEGGTFGYYLGLAMIFNLILNQGRFTRRFFVFALIGLTTISTNFYFSLLLFGAFYIYRAPIHIKVIAIALFIPTALLLYQLPFMGEKLDVFISSTQKFSEAQLVKAGRINRMAIFVNDMKAALEFPLGHGINTTALPTNLFGFVIDGTNGVSRIALRFGIFGLVYFLAIYLKLFQKLSLGLRGHFLFVIIMLMYIAANSMERDYFAMGIFWLYFLVDREDIINLVNSYQHEKYYTLGEINAHQTI